MARYVSTSTGIGRMEAADTVALLDLPFADLGGALKAGLTVEYLAAASVATSRDMSSVRLDAPVHRPGKVWLIGWAYRAHREETGRPQIAETLPCFLKAPSSVTGPYDAIRLPRIAPDRVDYEGEVAVIVGKTATDVEHDAGWSYVFGITAANDVSARDVQKGAFTEGRFDPSLGKSFDSFTPMGPCVTTVDELRDLNSIGLRTFVDGELRQEATTASLLYAIPDVISYLSRFTTLEPGDVILTGTPGGVGQASDKFLRPGNVVRIEVDDVGFIESRVVGPDETVVSRAQAGSAPISR